MEKKKETKTFWEGATASSLCPKENQNIGVRSTKQTNKYKQSKPSVTKIPDVFTLKVSVLCCSLKGFTKHDHYKWCI